MGLWTEAEAEAWEEEEEGESLAHCMPKRRKRRRMC